MTWQTPPKNSCEVLTKQPSAFFLSLFNAYFVDRSEGIPFPQKKTAEDGQSDNCEQAQESYLTSKSEKKVVQGRLYYN